MALMIDASPLRLLMVAVECARQALEKADFKLDLASNAQVTNYALEKLHDERADAYGTYTRCTIELSQRLAELVKEADPEDADEA